MERYMSAKRFDVHQVWRVFAIITQQGTKTGGVYEFDGLTAQSGDDGYTLEITDGFVRMNVFFHNTYNVDFDTEQQLDQFQLKLNAIEAKDKARAWC